MRYRDDIKFNDATIHIDEYNYMVNVISLNNIKNVLEFGLGASTFCFMENDCNITTFETSLKYAKQFPNVVCDIVIYENDKLMDYNFEKTFDIAFIDGPFGVKHLSRLNSCLFALSRTNNILLHDFNRLGEQETFKYIIEHNPEWKMKKINTRRGMGYLFRNEPFIFPEYFPNKT
jgi:hypothetical protein